MGFIYQHDGKIIVLMVKFYVLGVADVWGQMIIYLGHDLKKNVIICVRTFVIIYTSTESENDCFEGQIMKI